MAKRNVVERIYTYNQDRESERLAMKYDRMTADPFTFYRGTCHLFYEDWPRGGPMDQAPPVWICGDLHLENFGTYKGDNGLSYFDLNDFDEGLLAPATWEIARFLTSLWLAGEQIGVRREQGLELERTFLDAYRSALVDGKARWVEGSIATGMVRDLLDNLQTRKAFLESRTDTGQKGQRQLKMIPDKTLPVTREQRQTIRLFLERFARTWTYPERYRLLDVARRIAGTGSLGIPRYVALVSGKGPDDNYLIDIKQAGASSPAPYVPFAQPAWESGADRVVSIQRRMQAIAPSLLQTAYFDERSWVLRELQPSKDRLMLAAWDGKLNRLQQVVRTMGALVAWAQLRSSGRQGSATADELMAFGAQKRWGEHLVAYAQRYSETVRDDWRRFREVWLKDKQGTIIPNSTGYSFKATDP